jgi:parallel beta-helix repeat protein
MNIKGPKGRGGYSAIVYKDGSLYVAEDEKGDQIAENSNAQTVIHAAFADLTSGRICQERVKLVGEFEINSNIVIPSYTFLDLENASIKLANNSNSALFESNTDRQYITILGGILDGNKANQTTGWGIVFKYTCDHIAVIGTEIKNTKGHGMTFVDNEDLLVHGVRAHDCLDGIQLFYDNERGVVSNCICVDNDDTGFVVERSTQINLINNIAINSGYNGIIIHAGTRNNIIGNHVISNSRLYTDWNGILLDTYESVDSSNNIVKGNHCYDLQTPKRQAYGIKSEGDYNLITGNQLWGNKTGGLSKAATDIEANNITS